MTERSKKITAVVVVLLILAVGLGIFLANDGQTVDEVSPQPTIETQEEESTPASQGEDSKQTVTVRFTDSGFSPSSITVAAGDSITFLNESNRTVDPSSDPHPTHTINPELNVGDLAPGASKTITVTKTGQWGMHDHLDPSEQLTVIVQ